MSANATVKVNSLKWVKKDLLILLDEAQSQFQNYLETDDGGALNQVIKVLRQVSGTLTMVNVHGGVQLCDECVHTASLLLQKQVGNVSDAHESLLRALMHMGTYIDQVSATQKDQPSMALPVINDLRTVSGKELVTGFDASLSNISDVKPDATDEPKDNTLAISDLAKKLRPQFQLGLVAWLKKSDDEVALKKMQSVVAHLRSVAKADAASRLWWVSDGLLQALAHGGVEAGTAVKSLLGKVDRQIKTLSESTEEAFSEQISTDLIRSILYYLSRAKSDTAVVQDVKQKLRLAGYESAEEETVHSGPSDELLRTVSTSIKDDLNQAKDVLDIAGAKSDVEALSALPPLLTKIADTLGMIGLNDTRTKVRGAASEFAQQLEAIEFDKASLSPVADALLLADGSLKTYLVTRSTEQAENQQSSGTQDAVLFKVIDEAAKDLDDVREAILAHFSESAEEGQLEASVDTVARISGAMFVEELAPVRSLIDGLKTFIGDRLVHESLGLSDSQQDVLADLIAAIEYYFSAIKEGKSDTGAYLRVGDASLVALMAIPQIQPVSKDDDVVEMAEEIVSHDLVEVEEEREPESFEPVLDVPEEAVKSTPAFVLPVLLDSSDLPYDDDLAIISDDVDDEILEIFIEECLEEHERISEMFPQWSQHPEDQEICTTIRRSFHTLKGSGRLVGADLIGEYGWAMENMMNRLLEGQIERSPALMNSIEETIGLLPQMIEQLTGNKQPIPEAYENMAIAWSLAEGQPWQTVDQTPEVSTSSITPDSEVETAVTEVAEIVADDVNVTAPVEVEAVEVEPVEVPPVVEDVMLDDLLVDVEIPTQADVEAFASDETLLELDSIATVLEAETELEQPQSASEEDNSEDVLDWSAMSEEEREQTLQEELERELNFFSGTLEATQAEALLGNDHPDDKVDWSNMSEEEYERILQQELEQDLRFFAGTLEAEQAEAQLQGLRADDNIDWQGMSETEYERILQQELEQDLRFFAGTTEAAQEEAALLALDDVIEQDAPIVVPTVQRDAVERVVEPVEQADTTEPAIGLPEGHDYDIPEMDEVLVDIYTKESVTHILTVESQLNERQKNNALLHTNDDLTRALHTLHGSSRTAQMNALADVAKQLELYGNAQLELNEPWENDMVHLLEEGMSQFRQVLQCLSGEKQVKPDLVALLARVQPLTEQSQQRVETKTEDISESSDDTVISVDNEDELVLMFIEECEELIDECDETLHQCEEQGFNENVIQELQRQMHTLKGGARMAELMPMGDLSHAIEEVVVDVQDKKIEGSEHVIAGLRTACDQLSAMLTQVKEHGQLSSSNKTMSLLEQIRSPDYVPTDSANDVTPVAEVAPPPVDEPEQDIPEIKAPVSTATTELEYSVNTKDELTAIFVDEAEGLINECDNLITAWEKDGYKGDKAEDIQRQLHTLKGGARMAALEPIGDLGQALEDAINKAEAGTLAVDNTFVSLVNASADKLSDMVSDIKSKGRFLTAKGLIEKLNALGQSENTSATSDAQARKSETQSRFENVEAAPKAMTTGAIEQVRVNAHKLDQLVNNAGEVSIFHSRLAQRLNDFNYNLEELDQAVDRVQQHVRQISIETDAQIDSRIEQEATRDENFDPLEMDRYTQMQQLTRSLLETVSDLEDLRATLGGLVRDSETILIQQQRVSSSLQEGLMSTRMVNFEGLTSRFRRLARQTANTLDKKVDVYFSGVEHEVDRSIQENMISPLEHMIRNAISHGVESAKVRQEKGKPEKGTINLSIDRDGSYIVIRLEDDGAGIDPAVVREKAIERGLIEATDTISDDEVIQFILHSGFSTAKQVTQVAGRGVGMDVVSNEVKELGGTLNIQSKIGQGTVFVVRLPLTLAINQALMVSVEEQPYAIQLNAIEGVARVSSEDLQKQYGSKKPMLKYGDQIYHVLYLPKMMGIETPPELKEGQQNSLLLVHLGSKRYAIHVDAIVGRREVVVKPVGRQLSSVPGISGATILDDGKVAMILELGGLIDHMNSKIAPVIRTVGAVSEQPRAVVSQPTQVSAPKPKVNEQPTIMVVDDSITIRKVSTRFLERNHYKVVTAKDGLDAVAQLQEMTPDLMLLDIEMPRMDGYGVATHVRKTSTLKDLPIIMITSRTAEKHKQRAMDIGVNRYLGKPFQEDQLLENIEALLGGDES